MACVTQRTSILVYVVFHLISSLVICTRADVISECTNATICIGTYPDIYESLKSDENSYKIESAFYPETEPSSVLVFVNLYGQNGPDKTADDSMPAVVKYTWSLRSLYTAFPAVFLEISSLSSILVTPRTQELNITIPYFCCNVSMKDRKKMIKSVLAALQDLAVIPSLRDPRLNSAESVIEGHIPDIETTDRSYLKVVLWFSLLCPVFLGPFLYILVLQKLNDSTKGTSPSANSDGKCSRVDDIHCQKTDEPLIWSITFFCLSLLLIEAIFVLYKVSNSTEISKGGNTWHNFFVLLVLIPEWIIVCCLNCLCCDDLVSVSFFSRLLLIICTSCVSYHLSWVAIGIMVNPAWGVSILLILSFFFITLFFVINETTHANESRCSNFLFLGSGFLGLCFVVIPSVLVGQSFYGRETADDILTAALLSAIGAMSWLYFKSDKASSDASQCVKAAEKAAAAAKALAEKITVTKGDETEVHSAIVAAATASSSAAFAAAAAAKAVVDALPAAKNENPLCEIQSASGR